jgi:hypothetical protein
MNASSLPSYASLLAVVVVLLNLATLWLVALAMGENNGNVFSEGPPWIAVLSFICLGMCYYKIVVSPEVSFWIAVGMSVMGLWGAWVDYSRLADRRRSLQKSRNSRNAAS